MRHSPQIVWMKSRSVEMIVKKDEDGIVVD